MVSLNNSYQFYKKEFPKNYLQYFPSLKRMQRIYFYVTNAATNSVGFIYKIEINGSGTNGQSSVNMMLIYFLVAVASILIITWIVLTIIKIKLNRQN